MGIGWSEFGNHVDAMINPSCTCKRVWLADNAILFMWIWFLKGYEQSSSLKDYEVQLKIGCQRMLIKTESKDVMCHSRSQDNMGNFQNSNHN